MLSRSAKQRVDNHRRTITVETFECDDGTIDIELRLVDAKQFPFMDRERGMLERDASLHAINVRISVDKKLTVLAIETDLEAMPFTYCQGGAANTDKLVGARLDKGWRHAVRDALGMTHGCTHLAELLPLASTVAFQTLAISTDDVHRAVGRYDATREKPPFFVGGCHSWAPDSPVTHRYFPQFDWPEPRSGKPSKDEE